MWRQPLGAAMLAGLGCGLFGSLEETAAAWGVDQIQPTMTDEVRSERIARWDRATQAVLSID